MQSPYCCAVSHLAQEKGELFSFEIIFDHETVPWNRLVLLVATYPWSMSLLGKMCREILHGMHEAKWEVENRNGQFLG